MTLFRSTFGTAQSRANWARCPMGNMRHLPDQQASDQAASNRPSAGDSKIAQKKTKTDAQAMTIEAFPLLKRKRRSRHLPAHSSSSPPTISSPTPFLHRHVSSQARIPTSSPPPPKRQPGPPRNQTTLRPFVMAGVTTIVGFSTAGAGGERQGEWE